MCKHKHSEHKNIHKAQSSTFVNLSCPVSLSLPLGVPVSEDCFYSLLAKFRYLCFRSFEHGEWEYICEMKEVLDRHFYLCSLMKETLWMLSSTPPHPKIRSNESRLTQQPSGDLRHIFAGRDLFALEVANLAAASLLIAPKLQTKSCGSLNSNRIRQHPTTGM